MCATYAAPPSDGKIRNFGSFTSGSLRLGSLRFPNYVGLGNIYCKYYYETDANSPTQGQPKANPTLEKMRVKVAFGPLFSHSKFLFRGLGLVLYRKQTTRNPTQPNNQILRRQPIYYYFEVIFTPTESYCDLRL